MKAKNYDSRTALHLAASEGHLSCVKFLVETCQLSALEKDRWNTLGVYKWSSKGLKFLKESVGNQCLLQVGPS